MTDVVRTQTATIGVTIYCSTPSDMYVGVVIFRCRGINFIQTGNGDRSGVIGITEAIIMIGIAF